jgi:SAM-dependent methyltransferase
MTQVFSRDPGPGLSHPMAHANAVRSYSSGRSSFASFIKEALTLRRSYAGSIRDKVKASIADMNRVEFMVAESLGVTLQDLDILEIGPGQFLSQMIYLSRNNRVQSIDLEVIPNGFNPATYVDMLFKNGARRTAKTLGRKLMGIDRHYRSELMRQLGLVSLPRLAAQQMNACDLSFPAATFDFVYTRSVFHHLSDPAAALDGIARVLRPGGAVYILLHLYTSETGCLDPRIYTDRRGEVGGWLHLQGDPGSRLNNKNMFVNKLRLQDWRDLATTKMPGVIVQTSRVGEGSIHAAELAHREGKLTEYSVEELTTSDVTLLWKKPSVS